MMITVGQGNAEPRGEIVSISESTVDAYASALRSLAPRNEAWWAPVKWSDNHRLDKNWLSSSAAAVDVDYSLCKCEHKKHEHTAKKPKQPTPCLVSGCQCSDWADEFPSPELVARVLSTIPTIPGSLFHLTPHGFRVIFVFDGECTDRELARKANIGAGELVAAALERSGIYQYEVDKKILPDLARFFYTPNSIAKGRQRNAEVIKLDDEPFAPTTLAARAPVPVLPSLSTPTRREYSGDDQFARWNSDHPIHFERKSAGRCPVCDDKGSFGQLPGDETRWYCFSTDHPSDVGIAGQKGFHGDALDLEAHSRGCDRLDVLRRDGYLKEKQSPRPIGEPPEDDPRFSGAATVTPLFKEGAPWQPPVHFTDFDLPKFPVDALPPIMKKFVNELSTATQTPIDLPAMLSLSALAACCSRRAIAVVKPGYSEPLNLYISVVLGPGERKSAVLRSIIDPLCEWEFDAVEDSKPMVARSKQAFRLSEKALADVEARLIKAKSNDERNKLRMEAEQLAERHAELKTLEPPRLTVDDCTPEALASLLAAHDGRMAMMSAEGGIFSLLAGRYSTEPNLDVYLKAHAGDMLRVDRKGRPAELVENPALTVGLAVQPGVIEKLAGTPMLRSTGLLARFLYSMPTGKIGYRDTNPLPVSDEARAAYGEMIKRMLNFKPGKPLELRLDTFAFEEWLQFSTWLEPQMQEFEALGVVRDWGSKLSGAAVRIAGLFALSQGRPEIGIEDWNRAEQIARYLVAHALCAFSCMGLDDDQGNAKSVLRFLTKKSVEKFTKRDLFQWLKGRDRFKDTETLDKPLEILTQRNMIRPCVDVKAGRGRPSETYEISPLLLRNKNN